MSQFFRQHVYALAQCQILHPTILFQSTVLYYVEFSVTVSKTVYLLNKLTHRLRKQIANILTKKRIETQNGVVSLS